MKPTTPCYALQHRGQESCGIAVNNDGVISVLQGCGPGQRGFHPGCIWKKWKKAPWRWGIAAMVPPAPSNRNNAQPLLINHLKGAMALCHNGNLTNAAELREQLELNGAIFHATSDTEVICLYHYPAADQNRAPSRRPCGRHEGNQGSVFPGHHVSPTKLIAARDPSRLPSTVHGQNAGRSTVLASESCALDAIGATFVRDILPGEVVVVSKEGVTSYPPEEQVPSSLCVFEHIYFARPDSVIDGCVRA